MSHNDVKSMRIHCLRTTFSSGFQKIFLYPSSSGKNGGGGLLLLNVTFSCEKRTRMSSVT